MLAQHLLNRGITVVMPTLDQEGVKPGTLATDLLSDKGHHIGFQEASWRTVFGFEPEVLSHVGSAYEEFLESSGELDSETAANLISSGAGIDTKIGAGEIDAALNLLKANSLAIRLFDVVSHSLLEVPKLLDDLTEAVQSGQRFQETPYYLVKSVFLAKGITVSFHGQGEMDASASATAVADVAAKAKFTSKELQAGEYRFTSEKPRVFGVMLMKIIFENGSVRTVGNTLKGEYRDIDSNPYQLSLHDDSLFAEFRM